MKFLVSGCGSIGKRHIANLRRLGVHQLIACESNQEIAAATKTEYGIQVFERFDAALEQSPDAVLICTPTYLHGQMAIRSLEANAHVFIEKPIAKDLIEADAIVDAASKTNRFVAVGCNMRFHPGIQQMRKFVQDGMVGRVAILNAHFGHYLPNWRTGQDYRGTYSASYNEGGGIIFECIHELDYVRWLGGPIEEIQAFGGHISDLETDCEDAAILLLRFESGALGEIRLDSIQPMKTRGCEIISASGVLRWISEGKSPESVRVEYLDAERGRRSEIYRSEDYDASLMYEEELKQFIAAMDEQPTELSTLTEAREALRLACAARECVRESSGMGKQFTRHKQIRAHCTPRDEIPRSLERSKALLREAMRLIPSCSQTFSKAPTQFVQGVAPGFLQRGEGARVWDVDGNEYIDYAMALGPIILGHVYPRVTAAVSRQLQEGTVFSLPHPLEVEVAEMLTTLIPCAEMVRFGKNGSDATAGAVRIARAYTGRDVVVCCGYHGWQDWYIATTTRNRGIPKVVADLTVTFSYNDADSLRRIFEQHPGRVACVVMEPMGIVEPAPGFLQEVRELTRREGALLVFDEVVTGFRMAMGGAQEYFGVVPDLGCFGKAMANGFPIACVVGPRDLMQLFDEIFFSFTFGGEMPSLAASKATIREMLERDVISHLWRFGTLLKNGVNDLARAAKLDTYIQCFGAAPRTVIAFRDHPTAPALLLKSLFQQECLKRGVLFTGGQNICFSHRLEEIDYTLKVYGVVMEVIADCLKRGDAERRLEGSIVEPVFRRP